MLAEFARFLLENCVSLAEERLCRQGLGWVGVRSPGPGGHELSARAIWRRAGYPGEMVVLCPATGGFGGAGVQVAVAMVIRVIARYRAG